MLIPGQLARSEQRREKNIDERKKKERNICRVCDGEEERSGQGKRMARARVGAERRGVATDNSFFDSRNRRLDAD